MRRSGGSSSSSQNQRAIDRLMLVSEKAVKSNGIQQKPTLMIGNSGTALDYVVDGIPVEAR